MNLSAQQLEAIVYEELYSSLNESSQDKIESIKQLGFVDVEYVASGQYGDVFKGVWQAQGGVPRAIKVLDYNSTGKKEAALYRRISDARSKSGAIAKHFPKVDLVRVSENRKHIMIVMELLENDPNVKPVIEDLFGYLEVNSFNPQIGLRDLDVFKDIGYRANMMVIDTKSRSKLVNDMSYSFPNEVKQELQKSVLAMNFDNVVFPQKAYNKFKASLSYKNHRLWDVIDVAEEDLERTGEAAMSFLYYFLVYSMRLIKEYDSTITNNDILDELVHSAEHFVESYRNYTPVGIGGSNMPGAPQETEGLGYPGAKSLLKALQDLRLYAGLEGRDMHDRNVLVRPRTKDIVIVDVGLFKDLGTGGSTYDDVVTVIEGKKWSKSERSKRKKSCANPKGFTMKQFCKNQKTRSKKGQRKNEEIEEVYSDKQRRYMCAMSRQEGLSKAEAEEMCKGPMKKENIEERCQKGYKTHPTRKTKKMFGKTYRNCVKAEEGKDPAKGTGKKPEGSGRRLYTDEDPSDTVSVSFKSVSAIQKTLSKPSFKSKSHKRQSQIINLIHQRARAAYKNAKDPKTKARLKKAFDYATKRKEASKRKTQRMNKKNVKEEASLNLTTEELAMIVEEELEAVLDEKRKKAGTESSKESSLRDWFGRKGAKGKKSGWVDCNAPDGKGGYKACGRSSGEKRKRYPACRPTPGACKEKGRGKSWGKKGSKRKNK